MRRSFLFARGVAAIAALVLVSALASAAPAKRGKAKPKPAAAAESAKAGPQAVDPIARPEETAGSVEARGPSKQEAEPSPAAPEPAPASAALTASVSSEGVDSPAAGVSPAAADTSSDKTDYEALGRREAARLAAGRTEVGVTLSMDIGNRRFKYNDELGSSLRPYALPIAPMASFGLEAYPLATSDVPVLRDLGFRGRFSRAFALDSTTPEGDKIETSWTRYSGEVRERLLLPGRHPLELGALVGADASYFVMKSDIKLGALLPSARSIALRFGLDGRVLLAGRVSAWLGVAYMAVTSGGEIYEHFRDSHVSGIDGELGCAVTLVPGLEARLGGRYTRYFASFEPQVGDPYVAGGSLDEQLQVGLGVRYAH
ncbi:MAG TPA: hypothetical protein VFK05_20180 [Polyangiaceae bacterium]|nr:hypothetical protein [Polyangiaceae bacterium]